VRRVEAVGRVRDGSMRRSPSGTKVTAMPTAADVRNTALALHGVREIDHWGRPAWRTPRRIFAVMRPDGLYLNLPEQRKQFLFQAAPGVFVRLMWGKTANVIVQIAKLRNTELEGLIREAWQHAAPSARPRAAATSAARKTVTRNTVTRKKT
jgi:hypothetical protein